MTNERRIQAAQWVLERILSAIAAADTKVRMLSAFTMGMLAALAAAFGGSDPVDRTSWCLLWVALASAGMLLAVLFVWFATFPRVNGPPRSMIFFRGIAAQSEDDYRFEMSVMQESDYLADLAAQIHSNAIIADKKHRWVKFSMMALFIASLPWLVAIGMLVKL